MPFIDEILKYRTLAIIGMEKNTGKTECFNYILDQIHQRNKTQNSSIQLAVTSIGIDGERIDQVTQTDKPEIRLEKGTIFVTSESFYRSKRLTSQILDLSDRKTTMGRLVMAQVEHPGEVILSGPNTTQWLSEMVEALEQYKVDLTIVDGALSRKSSASPAVADALILTTGAAVSPYMPELVQKTKFILNLIHLPVYKPNTERLLKQYLNSIETGLYAITDEGKAVDLQIPSTLLIEKYKERLYEHGTTFYIPGVITDQILKIFTLQKEIKNTRLIVRDFTRFFCTPFYFYEFIKSGGKVALLHQTRLIALCVNPTSPAGYNLDSRTLCETLEKELQVPVYDIKQQN